MLSLTPVIKNIGYDGDDIRTFSFSAKVTHSNYPGVSVDFGGEPLVSLPRGTDLQEYVQMQFTHDQAFVAHMTNALEFEFIKAGLTVESAPLSPEDQRAQMPKKSMVELRAALRAIRTPTVPNGIYAADINALIDQIADLDLQEEARDYFNLGQYAERINPWVDILGAGFGLTPEEIDVLWMG